MQVLISYALIPEDHAYYLVDLEEEDLRVVLASQNMFGNADDWPEQVALSDLIERLDGQQCDLDTPIKITGDVIVIHTGFCM